MSYFGKRNFIVYDGWFDEPLEKYKFDVKNKKNNKHFDSSWFFYDQSNYKVGTSENYSQLGIKVNEKKIITNNYFEKSSEKYI